MLASGGDIETMILAIPIGPLLTESTEVLDRALGIFERLGDRTGVMSTVIAMAYARYGTVMHLTSSVAPSRGDPPRHVSRLSELVTESERARLDLQMLFGVHVYSRAKVVPDLGAVARRGCLSGGEAPGRPDDRVPCRRRRGDEPARARRRRRGRAVARPGRHRRVDGPVADARSIQLETWRGHGPSGRRATWTACAATSSGRRDRDRGGRASARCEALARLAIEAARLVAAAPQMPRWRAGPGARGARRAHRPPR